MNPLSSNLIRTYIPVLVGAVASWLAARGIHLQPQQTAWAVAAMTGVFTSAYYTIVRVLEERFPALGPLLLWSRPAVSLHVAGECPAQAEDYGDGWPPREDGPVRLGSDPRPAFEVAPDPADVPAQPGRFDPRRIPTTLMEPAMEAGQSPGPMQPGYDFRRGIQPAQPPAGPGSFAERVAPTGPNPVRIRKADTGAIPAYKRPPGR